MSVGAGHMPEIHLPPQYWNQISQDDRNEFIRLRTSFYHGQKSSSKDRRIVTFSKELTIVLRYLERSQENMECRCVLTGVCFVGPYVCVNTRQLKTFLGRCKSSINGSFQQLGYVALRTKAKARTCVITALPSLQSNPNILRQWTVRYVSEDTRFCFISSFPHVSMPVIEEDDLYDEKKARQSKPFYPQQTSLAPPTNYQFRTMMTTQDTLLAVPPKPLQTKYLDDDLPSIGFEGMDPLNDPDRTSSVSLPCLTGWGDDVGDFGGMSLDTHMDFGSGLQRAASQENLGEIDFMDDFF